MKFEQFPFDPRVAAGVQACEYIDATPIQAAAIPPALEGRDILGLAQTGTGKTAAFGLPMLQRLLAGRRAGVRALVLAPTRELAEQIAQAMRSFGRKTGLRIAPVYGGVSMRPQIDSLRRGADIVVACPGRLLDHISQRTADLRGVEILVLDEADMMLDMGFLPDVKRVISHLPAQRQNMMFSATMSDPIRRLADEILRNPETIQVSNTRPVETVAHALYPVAQAQKFNLLLELLRHTDTESVLVFTRTKHRAKRVGDQLARSGFRASSIQGNLSQKQRQEAMNGFRSGRYKVLVATDIAARGIDVSEVSHVINYDIPDTTAAYTHRIGRTGRAARTGDAFTLVCNEDETMIRDIERAIGSRIERRTIENFVYDKDDSRPGDTKPRNSRARKPAQPRTGRTPYAGKTERSADRPSRPAREGASHHATPHHHDAPPAWRPRHREDRDIAAPRHESAPARRKPFGAKRRDDNARAPHKGFGYDKPASDREGSRPGFARKGTGPGKFTADREGSKPGFGRKGTGPGKFATDRDTFKPRYPRKDSGTAKPYGDRDSRSQSRKPGTFRQEFSASTRGYDENPWESRKRPAGTKVGGPRRPAFDKTQRNTAGKFRGWNDNSAPASRDRDRSRPDHKSSAPSQTDDKRPRREWHRAGFGK